MRFQMPLPIESTRILQETSPPATGEKIRVDPCKSVAYFGCGTILKYGLGDFHPPGYFCCASSFDNERRMITSSPGFQFTGVATLCFAVSCIESSTRSTSSKFRPVLIG